MRLVAGPFRRFAGEWRFVPLGERASRIEFTLQYEFASRALGRLLAPLFDRIADSMVDAFVRRAEEVYALRWSTRCPSAPSSARSSYRPAPARDALVAAGFTEVHAVGVFGKRSRSTALREGDRVEIYRPLAVDPESAPQAARALPAKKR